MNERLLRTAPDITLHPDALKQTVGWSEEGNRPISLREFIAGRGPSHVKAALHINAQEAQEHVKRVTELTDEELRETVAALLREAPHKVSLAVVGQGDFSTDELIDEVRRETPLGQRLVAAGKGHIDLLERLVESGKVRGVQSTPPSIELPEFPF